MKNRSILLTLWVLTITVNIQSQSIENILFDGKKNCNDSFSPHYLVNIFPNTLQKDALYCYSMKKIKLTIDCDKKFTRISSTDTILNLGVSIMSIYYTKGIASQVYTKLKAFAIRKPERGHINPFFDFFKPGKFIILYPDSESLTIVSLNACSEPGKFRKILNYLIKKKNSIKHAFSINCGSEGLGRGYFEIR